MVELMARANDGASANGIAKGHTTLFADTDAKEKRRATAWLRDRINKSKALPKKEIIGECVDVTPALAALILLNHNDGNRPIRTKRVERWADVITAGRDMLTHQGISFSRDGVLNNGQHRLSAVVMTGRTVRMFVVFGEDRDAFKVLDTGGVRTGADILAIGGHKNTTMLSSSARLLAIIESGCNQRIATPPDVIDEIVTSRPGLEEATTLAKHVTNKIPRLSGAAVTVAVYLIQTQSAHADRLDNFIKQLSTGATGSTSQRHPVLVLRDGLMTNALEVARDGTGKNIHVCAAIINAWNRWVHNSTATKSGITWATTKPFPQAE